MFINYTIKPSSCTRFVYICCSELKLSPAAVSAANEQNFELKGFQFEAQDESLRAAQIVKVGIIQNKIVLPTSSPIIKQVRT